MASNTKILKVLKLLKIPSIEVMIVTVNGVYRLKDYKLKENDEVMLIPLSGGG